MGGGAGDLVRGQDEGGAPVRADDAGETFDRVPRGDVRAAGLELSSRVRIGGRLELGGGGGHAVGVPGLGGDVGLSVVRAEPALWLAAISAGGRLVAPRPVAGPVSPGLLWRPGGVGGPGVLGGGHGGDPRPSAPPPRFPPPLPVAYHASAPCP